MSIDTRITLRKLEILDQVVELGGVSRAANRLHVAQPVVTAHIRSLEERLGTKLFERSGRMLELTEAGKACHAWALYVLRSAHEVTDALTELADGSSGSVAVAADMTFGSYQLPAILAVFQRERPRVTIRIKVAASRDMLADVENGEVDFAVAALDADPSDREIKAEKVGQDRLVLVADTSSTALPSTSSLETVLEMPFIDAWQSSPFEGRLQSLGLADRRVAMSLGHPEPAKRMVRDGFGVAILPYSCVTDELANGVLQEIQLKDVEIASVKVPIFLVSRRDKRLGKAQLDLIESMREHLRTEGEKE